jgi:hypothetical protein
MITMKILLASAATLLAATFFQAPATPPMKMGLWESTSTAKVQQPDGTEKSTIRTYRNCVTETNWLTQMGPTAKEACPKANEVWTKDSYSFDVACQGKPKMASVSVHFDNLETQHIHLQIFAAPDGTPMKVDMGGETHWVSAACGDVPADHAVLVR